MATDPDEFVVIKYPLIKEFISDEGFYQNSTPITNQHLIQEYGNDAYLVRISWLENNRTNIEL
jgi:hypothetical protein